MFVGSADGRPYALDDANNGSVIWTQSADDVIAAGPVAVGDRVAVPSLDGKLYIFLASDGTELGSTILPSKTRAAPVVDDNELYVGTRDGTFVNH